MVGRVRINQNYFSFFVRNALSFSMSSISCLRPVAVFDVIRLSFGIHFTALYCTVRSGLYGV